MFLSKYLLRKNSRECLRLLHSIRQGSATAPKWGSTLMYDHNWDIGIMSPRRSPFACVALFKSGIPVSMWCCTKSKHCTYVKKWLYSWLLRFFFRMGHINNWSWTTVCPEIRRLCKFYQCKVWLTCTLETSVQPCGIWTGSDKGSVISAKWPWSWW